MSAFGDKPAAKEIDWQTWFYGRGGQARLPAPLLRLRYKLRSEMTSCMSQRSLR